MGGIGPRLVLRSLLRCAARHKSLIQKRNNIATVVRPPRLRRDGVYGFVRDERGACGNRPLFFRGYG